MQARLRLLLLSASVLLCSREAMCAGETGSIARHHRAGVGLGLRADAVREDLIVPLAHSGPGLDLSLSYAGWTARGRLDASAELGVGLVFDRFGHLGATLPYRAALSWNMPSVRGEGWLLLLGATAALDTRVNYLVRWDDAHAYWLGSQWLGPSAQLASRLGSGWGLESEVAFGVLGFLSRPPAYRYDKQEATTHLSYYFTQPFGNERFVTLADMQALRLRATARRSTGALDSFAAGWGFGVDARLNRASTPATNINLAVVLSADRAWSW